MITNAIKITKKGQITIPKSVRDRLDANSIYFDLTGPDVKVKPVKDAAGSLHAFAKNVKAGTTIRDMKDKAWEEAVREKTRKKSS